MTTDYILDTGLHPQRWHSSIWILLLTTLATVFFQVFRRSTLPSNAPKWFKNGDWPVMGTLRFYKTRGDWFIDALRSSPTGNFSFYVGKKQVVGLSGPEGRKTFFESRDLNF
ncbi:Uu.00g070230.m01.CDS01 [Anthostomella pinea]|uniref:Uu.00g070230.m01.CDS01 n=1 Tax=Anthostomella pinea TaxID=933095 RepID=A0AAI8VVV6_9PEZI|nr:Uu.00g070230.m01.CDS01 [Anthostomella pinea]